MAISIVNNLYPPIVDTYIPTFLKESGKCRIYFALSSLNKKEEINDYAQVSIRYQKNNKNALANNNGINTEIIFSKIYIDESIQTSEKYYIEIRNNMIKNGFQLNEYYKIQIRFLANNNLEMNSDIEGLENDYGVSGTTIGITGTMVPANFLNKYLDLFSEWSTVCLIKAISEIDIILNDFIDINESAFYILQQNFLKGQGKFVFKESNESEYVQNYQLNLFDYDNGMALIEAQDTTVININDNSGLFNYNFKTAFFNEDQQNKHFCLEINYQTNGGYIGKERVNFIVDLDFSEKSFYRISAEANEDIGKNVITLEEKPLGSRHLPETKIFYIYNRTSSESNFKLWETIAITDNLEPIEDFTIKSGVWYKYSIQQAYLYNTIDEDSGEIIDSKYVYTQVKKLTDEDFDGSMTEPLINLFEDNFLNAGGKQLKLQYDSNVSGYKRVTNINKIDTIGHQFPFVRKNNATNYLQFNIQGLITISTEDDEILAEFENNQSEEVKLLYENYNKENQITQYNDYLKEREYREIIIKFLYNDDVKLFRSLTEGNVICKLTEINLTPNPSLKNMIYSFSATAYEIDVNTLDNLYKYDIVTLPITLDQAIKDYGE